jgi:hypothetical protein
MSAPIEIAEQYSEFLATARSVRIDGLEFHDLPLKSMVEYSTHEPFRRLFLGRRIISSSLII